MTWHGKLPTYLTMEQILQEFFNSGVYIDFPISCRCGFKADSFTGVAIHCKKAHGVYCKRTNKKKLVQIKQLYKENSNQDKLPGFTTRRSLKNDLDVDYRSRRG